MTAAQQHMEAVGAKWRTMLSHYLAHPALLAAVAEKTAAFFAKYPGIERTACAEAFIAGLALDAITAEALSAEAGSQPAEAQPEKQKVA